MYQGAQGWYEESALKSSWKRLCCLMCVCVFYFTADLIFGPLCVCVCVCVCGWCIIRCTLLCSWCSLWRHLHLALVPRTSGMLWQLPHSPPGQSKHNRGKTTHLAARRHTDRQTDRRTHRQTDTQTDRQRVSEWIYVQMFQNILKQFVKWTLNNS